MPTTHTVPSEGTYSALKSLASVDLTEYREELALLYAHVHMIHRVFLRFRIGIAKLAGDDAVIFQI